ncbi:hypothetical protein ACIGCM_10215 [Pseudomonas sp. NPDC078700]|uniref:hypothetical protein n=1 Tax=Pseudomonas sp. NPDC078700 TaxID=3364424 RepID=UPI0037CADECD
MKSKLAISLALSLFAANAFALPSFSPQPLLSEQKDSQEVITILDPLAENGSSRTPGAQFRVAEGGAQRTLDARTTG